MNKLDLKKPIQTRDGLKVIIYATDHNCDGWPVVGAIIQPDGRKKTRTWQLDGRQLDGMDIPDDLINVPEAPRYRPWTAAEAVEHFGKRVKSKDGLILCDMIGAVFKDGTIGRDRISTMHLFERFTFLDGTPCGAAAEPL